MHIVCPHCATSYAVNSATFGQGGRTVRCARCKETWHAQPEAAARAPVMASSVAEDEDLSGWDLPDDGLDDAPPLIDSPSITSSMPVAPTADARWTAQAGDDDDRAIDIPAPQRNVDEAFEHDLNAGRKPWLTGFASRLRHIRTTLSNIRHSTARSTDDVSESGPRATGLKLNRIRPGRLQMNFGSACAGLAAMVMALIFWRGDVVRLMPQTGAFYKMVGLNVNLRNLAFRNVKVINENVDGKNVLMIEGLIVGEGRKQLIDLPRLRFIVRDDKGTEIYAWNAVLDQTALKPGETAWFRSRLASPPADSRSIDVRFYNKHDIGARGA